MFKKLHHPPGVDAAVNEDRGLAPVPGPDPHHLQGPALGTVAHHGHLHQSGISIWSQQPIAAQYWVTTANQSSVLGHSSQSEVSITWARCGKVAARQSSQEEMVAKLW